MQLISKNFFKHIQKSDIQWNSFQRIDNGWFASDFEQALFQGKPQFINTQSQHKNHNDNSEIENIIYQIIQSGTKTTKVATINKLVQNNGTSLLIDKIYDGKSLSAVEISNILKNISKLNPVLATIIAILNLDSLSSLLHHFANKQQKECFLPLFAKAKLIPFLKPTSLYETLDSQKSSIEGRVDREIINNYETLGIRVSFQDVILLGTSKSNCFYLNVNIKDFNNLHGDKTHLGTAICIISPKIKNITYRKGLKAYDDYLYYYACTGNNVFIPFSHIINEVNGLGKGLEYLYRNQCIASSIWPLAIAIPTNKIATLTAWYFAHLQKQNGRQLLSFKIVLAKLNEQFSQCLKLQLTDNLSLHNNLKPELLKFTALLNKETHISSTIQQLDILRGILGSNSHNIKSESNVRSFYKVAHLTTELDGMSHEINQLPLIKKAALACHPYYYKEVELLNNKTTNGVNEFDDLIFKHIGYILHNLTRTWAYILRTSAIGRLIFPKNKYKFMIKRLSCSFAFLSDITLINWAFKAKINTSFASYLGESIQYLTSSIATYDYYLTKSDNDHTKDLAKITLKNTLYSCQNALRNTINLAYNRMPALVIKFLLFPLGRPFHQIKVFKALDNDIESTCKLDENPNSPYTKYSPFLENIYTAKLKLKAAEKAEIAVTNATGTPVTTGNYDVLINRCLAAGIVSIEQSEQLRDAYQSILAIKLTNHFGNLYDNKNETKL